MEAFARLLSMLAVPLGLINIFGGIVSGIWLAVLGEWGLIGFGILALMVSGMGLGLAMAPGLVFAAPAAALLEKGKNIPGYFFGFLSTLYIFAVLVGWCILVLIYYTKQANPDSIIPILIWSYGIATGPIAWLAQKDMQSGSEYAMVATFFIQIAYLLTVIGILFVGMSLINVIVLFSIVMSVGMVVQFSMAYLIEQSKSYY